MQSVSLDTTPGTPAGQESIAITRLERRAVTVFAVRPRLDRTYTSVDVQAILPSGARVPLLRLHRPRPEWRWRYWLASPAELPAGSRLEVVAVPAKPDPDEPPYAPGDPFQVVVEFVRR